MAEIDNFNIEELAKQKREKYESLIKKASSLGNNQKSISLTTPTRAEFKLVDGYFISLDSPVYFVVKANHIENNVIKSYIRIITHFNDESKIQEINYLSLAKEIKYHYILKNNNSPFSRFGFDEKGNLEFIQAIKDDEMLITPKDAVDEINEQLKKLLNEIAELAQKKSDFEKLLDNPDPRKVVIGRNLKIAETCLEYGRQIYAAREYMARLKK